MVKIIKKFALIINFLRHVYIHFLVKALLLKRLTSGEYKVVHAGERTDMVIFRGRFAQKSSLVFIIVGLILV